MFSLDRAENVLRSLQEVLLGRTGLVDHDKSQKLPLGKSNIHSLIHSFKSYFIIFISMYNIYHWVLLHLLVWPGWRQNLCGVLLAKNGDDLPVLLKGGTT